MSVEFYRHQTMIPAPAAVAAPAIEWNTEDGIALIRGTTATGSAPLTTTGLYAPGCIYILVASGASKAYLMTGTTASPSWTLFGSVA